MIKIVLWVIAFFWVYAPLSHGKTETSIQWMDWSPQVFAKAQQENKLVILDLEAIWCHWCHVMDQKTYANQSVADYLNTHYIAIKVDQDAHPGLSRRYQYYGWPATIFFDAKGNELAKRSGYIAPEKMLRLLTKLVSNPTPIADETASVDEVGERFLSNIAREKLKKKHEKILDRRQGGLLVWQRYIENDSMEYALQYGSDSDKAWAKTTLDSAMALIDPVWGGVYQYSTDRDWQHPHFEKIIRFQAQYIKHYASGYRVFNDPRYLKTAKSIVHYMETFLLSPKGVFYASQDADLIPGKHSEDYFNLNDRARRALGIPRIDQQSYADGNGLMIEALASLYEVSQDKHYLALATTAANEMLRQRQLKTGGFKHGAETSLSLYLSDTLNMARGLMQLYRVTADETWLNQAVKAAIFMGERFKGAKSGYYAAWEKHPVLTPSHDIDLNIAAVRVFNLLKHYSGNTQLKDMAEYGMQYLTRADVVDQRLTEEGILMADIELQQDPLHITVVGSKTDNQARNLFITAMTEARWYKRQEWWDPKQGKLPNADVDYPVLGQATVFTCTNKRCSLPMFSKAELLEALQR